MPGNVPNTSRDSFQFSKMYDGVVLQQGVPIPDSDWNEMDDIRRMSGILSKLYLWGGDMLVTPQGGSTPGFKIVGTGATNDFVISAGAAMVGGVMVLSTMAEPPATNYYDSIGNYIADDGVVETFAAGVLGETTKNWQAFHDLLATANHGACRVRFTSGSESGNEYTITAYTATSLTISGGTPSPGDTYMVLPPDLITPGAPRTDEVYLMVWWEDTAGEEDAGLPLIHPGLGVETSHRKRLRWTVRVVENGLAPLTSSNHGFGVRYLRLATLNRTASAAIAPGEVVSEIAIEAETFIDHQNNSLVHGVTGIYSPDTLTDTNGGGIGTALGSIEAVFDAVDVGLKRRRAFTAVLTDGTESTGGDYNGLNAVDNIDSFTYGGRFLLRRGNYEWSSVTSLTKQDVTVIGELLQFGAGAGTDVTSIEIPSGASADFDLYGHFENVLFSSKASAYEYRFRNAFFRNVHVQSGMGQIIGNVDWRKGGTGFIRTGNSPSQTMGVIVQESAPYKPSGIVEGCSFYPPDPGGAAAMHLYALTGSSTRHIVFRNCIFDGSLLGEGMRIETCQLDIRFENCTFIGDDGAYALNADYANNRSLTFVNCTFWNDYGQVVKYNGDTDLSSGERPTLFKGCSFVAGGSAPTTWAAMAQFNGAFALEDCIFYVGDSAIIENPASASAETIRFGTSSGTHSYSVKDCRVEMSAWHGYTPIIFWGSDVANYEALVDNFTVDMSGASALGYSRGTSGVIRAAIMELIGLGGTGRAGRTVFARNISAFGIASGSTIDDSGALFTAQYADIDGLTLDGAAVQGSNVFTNRLIELGPSTTLKNINLFPGDVVNFSDASGYVIMLNGSNILVEGGFINEVPTSFIGLFMYLGSRLEVRGVNVDVNSWPATALITYSSVTSNSRCSFSGNLVSIANLNSGTAELLGEIGSYTKAIDNTVYVAGSGTGALNFTNWTDDHCLVDGNVVRRNGATSVAVVNTGSNSVTGDNVLGVA